MLLLRALLLALLSLQLTGCASLASDRIAGHLRTVMLAQDDPETVRAAAPAFLLLVESMIAESPEDPRLLVTGAELAASYGALLDDPDRRARLADRAYDYARRALCAEQVSVCATLDGSFENFSAAVAKVGPSGLDTLYVFATAWATWLEFHGGDMDALANLPKLELIFDQIIRQDPGFRAGRAQLYAGALAILRPAALGGQPDKARGHFEEALRLSDGKDLMIQVEYARRYARQALDQPLHDRLLNQALSSDPVAPGLTLTNLLAQEEAKRLLAEDWFAM
ncbi:MAG: TRAP transporter TatT component family protein [Chromatiaceae bacterium]